MNHYADICLTIINQQIFQVMKGVNFFLTLSLLTAIALAIVVPTTLAKVIIGALIVVHIVGIYYVNKKS